MKEPRKKNSGPRRSANRRGGSGRGITPASASHAMQTLDADLAKSAQRSVEQHLPLPAVAREVLAGVLARAFAPSLNRQAAGHEVSRILELATRERSEIDVPRSDRPEKFRAYRPAGAQEFAHGQLSIDLFLALRWGSQAGLPSPNPLLDQVMERVPGFLKATYGEGLDTLVVCLHPPNPHLDAVMRARGWRGTIPDPAPEDKIGGWNLHLQVYISRVRDRKMQTERHLFSHAGDTVVSSFQLRELGVDLDEHRASRFRARRESQYALWLATSGRRGLPLAEPINRKLADGKITAEAAISAAVDADLKRKAKSWKKAETYHSLMELNKAQVTAARESQSIDLLLAEWFSAEIEKGLPGIHPGYADLIKQAREVFPLLKRRQIASGHRLLLNEVLTEWERERRAEQQKHAKVAASREAFDAGFQQAKTEVLKDQAVQLAILEAKHAATVEAFTEEVSRLKRQLVPWESWSLEEIKDAVVRVAHGNPHMGDHALLSPGTMHLLPRFSAFLASIRPKSPDDQRLTAEIREILEFAANSKKEVGVFFFGDVQDAEIARSINSSPT